jgi:hypothetical protein
MVSTWVGDFHEMYLKFWIMSWTKWCENGLNSCKFMQNVASMDKKRQLIIGQP